MVWAKPIFGCFLSPFLEEHSLLDWISSLSSAEHVTIFVIVSLALTEVALIPWLQRKIYEKEFIQCVRESSFILNIIVLSFTSYHIFT